MRILISQRIATGKHHVTYGKGNGFSITVSEKLKTKFAI